MRVAVADDAVIIREGLGRLLAEAGFEVVGLAGDAEELFEQVTHPVGSGRQQLDRVAGVDVLREDEDSDLRPAFADRLGRPQALVEGGTRSTGIAYLAPGDGPEHPLPGRRGERRRAAEAGLTLGGFPLKQVWSPLDTSAAAGGYWAWR